MPINSFLYPAPSTPIFAYNVANSCRFDDGSSASLTKSVSGTSQTTAGTISFWFKRSDYGSGGRDVVISQAQGDAGGSEPSRTIISSKTGTGSNGRQFSTYISGGNKYMNQGLENDKWTHIALVHDTDAGGGSTGQIQWYYNGIQHNSPQNVNVSSNDDGEFYL